MFRPYGALRAGDSGVTKDIIIDQSDVFRAFDAASLYADGNLIALPVGRAVFGIVIGIWDKNGLPISPEDTTLTDLGGGTLDKTVVPFQYTADSDNEDDEIATCRIDLSPESIFEVDQNGTIGTANDSEKPGGWIDVSDQRTLDESTLTRTVGTGGQFYNWGRSPKTSTKLLASIHESEVFTLGKVFADS